MIRTKGEGKSLPSCMTSGAFPQDSRDVNLCRAPQSSREKISHSKVLPLKFCQTAQKHFAKLLWLCQQLAWVWACHITSLALPEAASSEHHPFSEAFSCFSEVFFSVNSTYFRKTKSHSPFAAMTSQSSDNQRKDGSDFRGLKSQSASSSLKSSVPDELWSSCAKLRS